MSTASLTLYRRYVPAHASVSPETVELWLEEAASALGSGAWGTRFAQACVWWAAHHIERLPKSGAPNISTAEEAGQVSAQSYSQSDGAKSSDLSRSYATASSGSAEEQFFRTTRYGEFYLALRHSRLARAPFAVGPCS